MKGTWEGIKERGGYERCDGLRVQLDMGSRLARFVCVSS